MYEKELSRIIDASRNNALTFFVGAGVSTLSGAPTWKDLIDAINIQMGKKTKKEYSYDDFLKIPQVYYYSLGSNESEYYRFITSEQKTNELKPNNIHLAMLNLNPVSFITTNFDSLLEDVAIQRCQGFKVVSQDKDVPQLYGDRFILKIHGDLKNKNIVLKEEDYLNYSENFKLIETLTKSIFATNTVVFIGYGLNDYNIKLILNWVKTLLKGNFRKPIFIHTGSKSLSTEELLYQESKGLDVIDCTQISSVRSSYLDRYQALFQLIKTTSEKSLENKTEDEAFDILYNLLLPLDKLNALRIEDVNSRLSSFVRISEDGVIHFSEDDCLILKRFLHINHLSVEEQKQIDIKTIEKYQSIIRVFKKARVNIVASKNNKQITSESIPFSDERCTLFDYKYMYTFSERHYHSDIQNFRKAFYLSRLQRHDTAFFLFSEMAHKAFEKKDYLLYYLAESNCISLSKVIKSKVWDNRYNKRAVEELSPNESEIEDLFRRLPASFRNEYSFLNNLHNVNLLYKYAYGSFVAGQKLQTTLDSESIEFGMTSSGTVILRINSYLHFLLGNGIIADIFTEFINTVKYLMSILVHKYSSQQKQTLYPQPFPFQNTPEVFFDEIDFYCFVSYFSDKEIDRLFNKHGIKTIEFQHMDLIEVAINNLLSSYELARKDSKYYYDILHLERQIKTSLTLLKYVNTSQKTVDSLCLFILKNEFREIHIDDKIIFIDSQIYQRKKYSESTSRVIERTLIHYIDLEISSLMHNKSFSLASTRNSINYFNLVNYIQPKETKYISSKLSIRVKQIFSNDLSKMYRHVFQYYYEYLSSVQQKRAIVAIEKELNSNFSFDLFSFLIWRVVKIDKRILEKLVSFLRGKVEESKRIDKKSGVIRYPEYNPFEELEQVGYWCFIGRLYKNDYIEFLGYSNLFNFLVEFSDYDFSLFDVAWLLNFSDSILKKIVENSYVKEKIRSIIVVELEKKKIPHSEYEKLNEILIEYFC